MEDIVKLIEIAKKKGQRSIQLVNQNFRKKEISKDNQLYEGIIKGVFLTDDIAAKKMFGEDPGNRNYRNAKGKLKNKLLNHLYFLDYEKDSYTMYERNEYECMHTLHHCKILIREGANDIAFKMLPALIKTAKDFELADIVLEALTLLRNEYAYDGKTTPFSETNDEIKIWASLADAINESSETYHEVLTYINKSLSSQNRILEKVPALIEQIDKRAKKHKSTTLEIMALKLRLLYNQLTWKFDENVKLCDQIEKKYLNVPNAEVMVDLSMQKISFIKMYSFYSLREVKKGAKYAEERMDIFRNGSYEWFSFIEYYFLLMMKGGDYDKAGDIFRTVRTNKNYGNLDETDKDRWTIYRAYLVFMNDAKLLKWGFDLDGFISSTPDYGKDVQGFNVAVIIIQFMYLLREGNIKEVRKKVDEANQYSSTHLDKRHNYRNSIFIRLMNIVTEKNFDYEVVEEKCQNYYGKLQTTHIPDDIYNDLEIIPFERLWDIVLHILKTNKLYVHFRFYAQHV